MHEYQTRILTGADLIEISAEKSDMRYELIEGRLIEMPPTGIEQGCIGSNIVYALKQ